MAELSRPDDAETRQLSRNRWLIPVALLVLALVVLASFPFIIHQQIARLRSEIIDAVEPARTLALDVQLSLATQLSAVRGQLLAPAPHFSMLYLESGNELERDVVELLRLASRLGAGTERSAAGLVVPIEEWRASADAYMAGTLSGPEYVAGIPRQQEVFERIIEVGSQLDNEIVLAEEGLRQRIRSAERIQLAISLALIALALLCGLVLGWLGWRLRTLASGLSARVRYESLLRDVASTVAAASSVADVMHPIAESATRATRAFGAYVERVESTDGDVEMVAGFGSGIPPLGTRVPYPGSLTEEMITRGTATLVTEVGDIGERMAPYLAQSCRRCSGLIVPLVGGGEVLGALVLLRSLQDGAFGELEVQIADTLADLASVALQRARLLEKQEAAVGARDEVVAIVSHDLRNPLSAIIMAAGLLSDPAISLGEQKRAQQLAVIKRSAEQMNRLIQDLLDAATIEAGKLPVERVAVDADSLIPDVCDSMAALASRKRQRLVSQASSTGQTILADRDRILQVFSNLVGNALKFTPEGGLITLDTLQEGSFMQFSVSDNGPGIPREHLEHLFDRFWQVRKERRAGAGLGLAISKGIVDAHGGRIWVESEEGAGTTVCFTIPLAEPAERRGRRPAQPRRATGT